MNSTTKVTKEPSGGTPAAVAAVSSPSLMVFLIRPTSGVLKGGVPVLAQQAGFAWRNDVHGLGLLDHDVGDAIATLHTHGFKEAMGELSEIEIRIDPEACAIGWKAGERLMEASEKLATLFDANLCGASGGPLSEADRESIAEFIDAIMLRRRDAILENERRGEIQPDGSRRCLEDGLSFVTTTRTRRGKYLSTNYFDVPAVGYYEGLAIGTKLGGEMLDYMKRHKTKGGNNFENVMETVGHLMVASPPPSFSAVSTTQVARGFMRVMQEMVIFGASHSEYQPWLDAQIKNAEAARQSELKYLQSDKDQFVQRMKAAREKKRVGFETAAAPARKPVSKAKRPVAELV